MNTKFYAEIEYVNVHMKTIDFTYIGLLDYFSASEMSPFQMASL